VGTVLNSDICRTVFVQVSCRECIYYCQTRTYRVAKQIAATVNSAVKTNTVHNTVWRTNIDVNIPWTCFDQYGSLLREHVEYRVEIT